LLRKNLKNPAHDESRWLYPIIGTPRPDFQSTKAAFGTQKALNALRPKSAAALLHQGLDAPAHLPRA
jgi:hypothetical protein